GNGKPFLLILTPFKFDPPIKIFLFKFQFDLIDRFFCRYFKSKKISFPAMGSIKRFEGDFLTGYFLVRESKYIRNFNSVAGRSYAQYPDVRAVWQNFSEKVVRQDYFVPLPGNSLQFALIVVLLQLPIRIWGYQQEQPNTYFNP